MKKKFNKKLLRVIGLIAIGLAVVGVVIFYLLKYSPLADPTPFYSVSGNNFVINLPTNKLSENEINAIRVSPSTDFFTTTGRIVIPTYLSTNDIVIRYEQSNYADYSGQYAWSAINKLYEAIAATPINDGHRQAAQIASSRINKVLSSFYNMGNVTGDINYFHIPTRPSFITTAEYQPLLDASSVDTRFSKSISTCDQYSSCESWKHLFLPQNLTYDAVGVIGTVKEKDAWEVIRKIYQGIKDRPIDSSDANSQDASNVAGLSAENIQKRISEFNPETAGEFRFSIKNPVVQVTATQSGQLKYLWALPNQSSAQIYPDVTLQASFTKSPASSPPYNNTGAWDVVSKKVSELTFTNLISQELVYDLPAGKSTGTYWACGKIFGVGSGTPEPQCYQFQISTSAATQDNIGTLSVTSNLKRVKKGESVEFTATYRNYEDTGTTIYRLEFQVTSIAISENTDLLSIPATSWYTKCTDAIYNNGEERGCKWETNENTELGFHAVRARVFFGSDTLYAKSFISVEVSNEASVAIDGTVPDNDVQPLSANDFGIGPLNFGNPFEAGTLAGKITSFAMDTVGILAFLSFLVAGIIYITSGGDPAKAEKAKKTMIWSIVALVVMVLSYGIVTITINAINSIFG